MTIETPTTTTLYLCRGCTILLGRLADDAYECPNCGHPGPHVSGEFEADEAQALVEGGETS